MASHHLPSGEDAFFRRELRCFFRTGGRREKEGQHQEKRGQSNIETVAMAMEGAAQISRLIRSPPSPR